MVSPWPVISSETIHDLGLFRIRRDRSKSPRTGGEHDFLVVEMADWVQVVSFTKSGELIFVHQYRQGSRRAGLELPGGLVDPGEGYLESARRELLEETGYGGGKISQFTSLNPQPALFSNQVHILLATGLERVAELALDDGEDIEVVLIEPDDLPGLIRDGKIENAVTLAALSIVQCSGQLDQDLL